MSFGYSQYEASVAQMNNDIQAFRSEKEGIIGTNMQLAQEAKQAYSTKQIEGIIENVNIAGASKLLLSTGRKLREGQLPKALSKRLGVKSLKEGDDIIRQKIIDRIKSSGSKSAEIGEDVARRTASRAQPSLQSGEGNSNELTRFIQEQKTRAGIQPERPEYDEEVPEQAEASQQVEASQQAEAPQQAQQAREMTPEQNAAVDKALEDAENASEEVESAGQTVTEGLGSTVRSAGQTVTEGLGSTVDSASTALTSAGQTASTTVDAASTAVDAASTAVEEGSTAALEGLGGLLDATGIFAPLGFLLNIGGAIAGGYGLYEAGKSIYDEVKGPDKSDIPQITVPKAPLTMAQKGLLITPHSNSLDLYGSVQTSW